MNWSFVGFILVLLFILIVLSSTIKIVQEYERGVDLPPRAARRRARSRA